MGSSFSTYYGLLRRVHEHLRPRRYLEIGVHRGHSLAFVGAGTEIVGVDPEPLLELDPPPQCTIVAATSDEFFADPQYAELRQVPFDLVFVDGLHHFEQSLRDILNAEQLCHRGSVIMVHDCLPIDAVTSERERHSIVWSGDVWKSILALKRHRPDLCMRTVDAEPTGLGLLSGFGAKPAMPPDWLEDSIAKLMPLTYDDLISMDKNDALNVVPPLWPAIKPLFPDR